MSLYGLCVNTDDGVLTINGVSFATPMIYAFDLWDLFLGSDLKGTNSPAPQWPGSFPNRLRQSETTYDLPFLLDSAVDHAGTPYDPLTVTVQQGFERNIKWLRQNVIDPTSAKTVNANLVTPDGDSLDAPCQVLRIVRGIQVHAYSESGLPSMAMKASLKVRFPYGGFNWS